MMQGVAASDVAVIVPVGGPAASWPRAAKSLARLDPPPGEIIVVIDGRNDAAAADAASIGATVVQLKAQGGPARARNKGALVASREILLFIDADVEVPPSLVAGIAAVFSRCPEITAVMGSYDNAPSSPGLVSQYRNLLHHFVHQNARADASTFWAGCGGIRRQAFLEAGGFDERFTQPSIEDIELGSRLARSGHPIRLDHALQVTHLKAWGLRDTFATDLWRRAVPWTELILSNGRMVNDLNVTTRDRVSVALAFVAPVALLGAWRAPRLLAVAAGAAAGVVALNARFFRFLARERGAAFAARAVPLHWTYLLVCGLGFSIGVVRHLSGRRESLAERARPHS